MSSRLTVNPGTPHVWQIELKPGLNRIGSGEENDFRIPHSSVGALHCELTVTDTTVTLKNLGSNDTTFVERVSVTEFQLHNGQHVQIGAVHLIFETDIPPELPSPAVNLPGTGARIILANPGTNAPSPPAAQPSPGITFDTATARAQSQAHADDTSAQAMADRRKFVMAVVGAICGGLVGMFGWYVLIKMLHMEIGYAAIMVGAATGAGARLLARQGSSLQGIVCAVCALFAIIGGQYLTHRTIAGWKADSLAAKNYSEQMKWAKSAVQATNDANIVQFIATRQNISPLTISADEITGFRETELPQYLDLLNGKPTKEEYVIQEKASIPRPRVVDSIGLFTVVWSLFGIVAAWRIGSGNEG